jgi:hypothetical protein
MISTSLGYQLYGQNLPQSLQRTAAEPGVTAAQAYYKANIGSVKTVDDLVNNYRLLSYAAQAFGLSNMTYAKALLKSVLTSNLSDSSSVANKLGGSYVAFAQAFNFNTNGTLNTTAQMQSSAQQSSTETLFALTSTLGTSATSTASTNYQTAIGSITSLTQLEQTPAALGYVLDAYSINPSTASSSFEQTLESNLSSPTSYVNQQANDGYLALYQAFTVNSDGSAANVAEAETNANVQNTVQAYLSHVGTSTASQTAAATATSYFESQITGITSASQLVADPKLVAYLTNAYQLPSTATATTIEQALTSNRSDATSYANTSPYPGYLAMAKAFNFNTSGAAQTVTQFQSMTQQQQTEQLYMARQTTDSASADTATAYYNANIGSVKSIADLENNKQLLSYVETAYGIDSSTSNTTLQSVMENTNGIDTSTANAGLLALKIAFNVDSNGNVTNPLTAQSSANVTATTSAYLNAAGTSATALAAAKAATAYYQTNISHVTSVGNLLSDPKMVAYIEQAYGIPKSTSTGVLNEVLTSDLTNSKSVANKMGTNYAQLAAAFDFTSTGLIGQETQGAQSKAQLESTNAGYVQQQMETEAGTQNPGIALALYFQNKASSITSAYSILSDSKLVTVFQTMMGLPSTASEANIDVQANQISSAFDLSKLKDPTYVKSLIQRFSVMYDLNPPTSTAPYTATSLLSGSTNTLGVNDLFGGSKTLTTVSLFESSAQTSSTATSFDTSAAGTLF